jgi:hypothetical protein
MYSGEIRSLFYDLLLCNEYQSGVLSKKSNADELLAIFSLRKQMMLSCIDAENSLCGNPGQEKARRAHAVVP